MKEFGLIIFMAGVLIFQFNALGRIKTLESHLNIEAQAIQELSKATIITGKAIQNLQYEIDVISESRNER